MNIKPKLLIFLIFGIILLPSTWAWADNGISICANSFEQREPQIAPNGLGGAYIVWKDLRNGHWDIYIEQINEDGGFYWGTLLARAGFSF